VTNATTAPIDPALYPHVLIATDFSPTAEHALAHGIALAQRFHSKVTIVHAFSIPLVSPAAGAVVPNEDVVLALSEAANKNLDALVARVREKGVEVEGMLRVGFPDDEVLAAAEVRGTSLIVVGTHGRRGVRRLLLGSVAENIVRRAKVPVLVVRDTAHDESG
jgi:nucleotide-binding universal stress UspA family protein